MPRPSRFVSSLWLIVAMAGSLSGASPRFQEAAIPFLTRHCVACHGQEKQKAGLTLHQFKDDLSVLRARRTWKEVLNMVVSGGMPPEDRDRPAHPARG